MKTRRITVGLGGTFDHFHDGHHHLLSFAANLGTDLVIGITSPEMTRHKKYASTIESFGQRAKNVQKWCNDQGITHQIIELTDPYGPAIEANVLDKLVVTTETQQGAQNINTLRSKLRLPELPVHVCTMLKDETGEILHADKIRAGVVDRSGRSYHQLLKTDLDLNPNQRQFFSSLQGKLVKQPSWLHTKHHQPPLVFVVGDHSLIEFLNHHWPFDLGSYDLQSQRTPVVWEQLNQLAPDLVLDNPAGHINHRILSEYLQWSRSISPEHSTLWRVVGEEDLLVVALVLLAPLESAIYYGQPNQGLVEIIVTEKKKNLFAQQFDQKFQEL